MFFLIREIAGWLLLGVALFLLRTSLVYVEARQVVEGGVLVMASLGVMKAGLSLIRVSTAARIVSSKQN